jgi:hypothetical protein
LGTQTTKGKATGYRREGIEIATQYTEIQGPKEFEDDKQK